ncbi:copii coat assembly protein sec16 [Diplodia corticola]|uniref:Protein transport protein sec16 n=1 Tax=Diplodia corticola TaxID=236234 RepID=A0A1J9RM16_9PEZI|nr:copii coat assembly protein sec16 [Diplodia corticola]OJD29551.1 copii coat assembly protein sec16 [Diplodia corticola]
MHASPAASPPEKAPSDDQSASWNPALRPDSAHAPAPLSTTTHDNTEIDSSAQMADVDAPFDSPPPRTSEDRHPLNDDERPRFVFDEEEDEFDAWHNDDDGHLDLGHDDAGARTPLATERSATPQPPAPSASVAEPHESHDPYDTESNVAEATAVPPIEQTPSASEPTIETAPVEHPASPQETAIESTPIEQSAPELEPAAEPAPAEQAEHTEQTEQTEPETAPTIDPTSSEQTAAEAELAPTPAEEAQPTPTIEHEQPDIETIDTEALHETNPPAETPAEHSQEQNYEHQGETTTLEEAVQESAQVPLANDAGTPALEWGASDSAFDLGSSEPAAAAETPQEPAPEFVNEHTAEAEPEPEHAANVDWGDVEDDAFDLGGQESAQPADAPQVEQDSSSHQVPTAVDLDWGTAADDDFSFGAQQTTAHEEPQSFPEPQPAPQTEAELDITHPQQPLSEEPNAAATLDWGEAANADFDLETTTAAPVQEAPAVESKAEAAPPAEQPSGGPDLDWGTSADDDFGFSAVTQENHTSQPTELTEPKNEGTDKNEEADLSAMWAEALADDDLLDEPSATEPSATEPSVDPSAFFLDDDEGFLDDTLPAQNGTAAAPTPPAPANKYAPAAAQAPLPAAPKNPYAPQGLQTTNASQPVPAPVQTSPYAALSQPYQQPQRPAMSSSAQSFAAKGKGGYSSPYDLPDDLAKQPPRKKIVHAPTIPAPQSRAPPPTSSGMYSNASSPSLPPPTSTFPPSPMPVQSPMTPSGGFPGHPASKTPSLSSKPSTGDFFEDLPIVAKPRPAGRYTPQIKGPTPSPPPMAGPPPRQSSQTYGPPPIVPPPVGAQPQMPGSQSSQASQAYAPSVVPPPAGAQPQRPGSQPPHASQAYAPPPQPQRSSSHTYAPPVAAPAPPQRSSSHTYAPPAVAQLQEPQRLNPFPDLPPTSQPVQGLGVTSAPPAAASRYSPAPPAAAAATSRYSPAPPAAPASSRYSPASPAVPSPASHNRYSAELAGPPKGPALPFAPRTSSPLAYHSTPDHGIPRPSSSGSRRASLQPSVASGDEPLGGHGRSSLELVREIPENEQKPATPPPPRSIPGSAVASPARRTTANYTPQYQQIVSPPGQSGVAPPRRAQSQSPGATMKGPLLSMAPIERPASTNGVTPPSANASPYTPFAAAAPTSQPAAVPTSEPASMLPQQRPRRPTLSELSYVKPTDETVNDPLERWKGAPIFKWGIGGTILTSFPQKITRYGTGSVMPLIKCTPGEVQLQKAKEICPLWDPIAKFPGPLKTKSQKKQALSWLHQSIETMEKDYQSKIFNGELPAEARIRFEEKILLWKVLEVFVEHDGHLEGSDVINQAVQKILANGQDEEPQLSSPVDIMGSSATTGSVNTAEPIDPKSVEQLRAHLLKGNREKAVWDAADKRLWGHAMLIASTMNKDIWKQVAQEFVRQEVRKVAGDNQSLAALYEVFAGNWEESIDELVPASARAGFQMVSKTDRSGANTNVFAGLDRWRETLVLVVNNRSDGDPQALLTLGKLLAGYGRVEAAHICYLFARSAVILGGADDLSAHVVLIGADQVNQRSDIGRDIEPILLTEIFEYAVSLSAPTAPPAIPHLQAYKLAHAFALSEYGYRTEAQAYCDAITTAMKSTTRSSPYYNASLVQELDDLIKRLSEAPKDSSSWISKPTMGKVSSTVWSSFNKFVAGEEDDAESTGPGGTDTSPFAKVSGDTPSVSRSPSTVDMYGTYSGGSAPYAPSSSVAGSRYAPSAGGYAPRTSGEQPRSRYDPVGQSPYQPHRPAAESGERHEMPMDALFAHQGTPPSSYNPPTTQYAQQPKVQSPYAPSNGSVPAGSPFNPLGSPYTPTTSGFQSLGASVDGKATSSYEPPSSNFGPPLNSQEAPSNSYDPPTSSYEPPSYQPYEPEPEAEEEAKEEKAKKKSFMDDDDDDEIERRAAAVKAQQKAEADRIADEAFRKAAEADAAKPAGPKKTGSWLGGWFKRSDNGGGGGMGDAGQGGNKPIRAKLGEENSFYYDPDLKKWVNKKAGPADHSKPAATPPPPKGGPPLRPSASMANLAGPPPSAKAAGLTPPGPPAGPLRSTSMPPPMAASAPGSGAATPVRSGSPAVGGGGGPPGGAGGPPSRPATSMSNASSIDDLIGVPAPRKGPAAKKKGRGAGRYVDVMAK